MTVIFGGSLLFWGTAASLPSLLPPLDLSDEDITITGTPADTYPDSDRAQLCGTGNAKSTDFIKEYKIPTECTNPFAIVTDPDGTVWFAESNGGRITKFDPDTETFTEFDNPLWPPNFASPMWGMDYSPDGKIVFTDSTLNYLWKFSIQDETYEAVSFPTDETIFLQRLKVDGSRIIINDLHGGNIVFLNLSESEDQNNLVTLPSVVEGFFAGGFDVDADNNLWYTNWMPNQGGILVKFDKEGFFQNLAGTIEIDLTSLIGFVSFYEFPPGMTTPNGLTVDNEGKIWSFDTSSSFFFQFDPVDENFTRYVTSDPTKSSYGNSTGLIKSTPISRPYWSALDDNGRIIFVEQTANRISVFDPHFDSIVEYMVPSKNPNWADCEMMDDCGIAQIFGHTVDGNKVWFTEWVENNIGVLDTSIQLPFEIQTSVQKLSLKKGETSELTLELIPTVTEGIQNISIVTSNTSDFSDLTVDFDQSELSLGIDKSIISVSITASESSLSGTHKVLIGAQNDDVTISKYVTVTIES